MVDSNFTGKTAANTTAWAGAVVLSLIAPFGSTAHADPIVPPSSACVSTDGVTIVCTGDLSEGIRVDTVGGPVDTYRILQIKEATGRIEPAERIDGVFFKTEKRNLTIDIDDVDIVTNGYQADGIDAFIATGAGEYEPGVEDTVDLTITHAGNIETNGATARGIKAAGGQGDGTVNIKITSNGNITTSGENSEGIVATIRTTGKIEISHTSNITTTGAGTSHGIYTQTRALTGGDIIIRQFGNITTSRVGIVGFADGEGDLDVQQEGEINARFTGIELQTGYLGDISTDNVTLVQHGDINFSTDQSVSGEDGIQIVVLDHGQVSITKTGDIRSPSAKARYGIKAEVQKTGGISINASLGTIEEGIWTRAFDGNINIELSESIVLNTRDSNHGGAGIWFKQGASNTLITRNNVTINGLDYDVLGGSGSEAITNYGTLTMLGNTDLGDGTNAFNNHGVFNSGLTLDLGDDTFLFTNSGTVSIFGDDVFGETLITGSWVGQPNSGLRIDAVLDDGTSGDLDILKITGATSGTTLVFVINQGGEGGLTGDGPTDGIQITEIGGESVGHFELGHQVFAGLAEYQLVKADGKDWYLQSILAEDDPGEIGDPGGDLNSINDSAISSVQIPRSLHSVGTALTGSRKDRLNGQEAGNAYGLALNGAKIPGSWARIVGGYSDGNGTVSDGIVRGGVFGADTSHEENFWALQGGFTAFTADDRLTGSVFFHYGGIDIDHTNKTRNRSAGSTEMAAWGGGVSVTWLDPRGFYVDGVMTATAYDIDMLDSNDDESSTDARAQTVSGEVGYQLAPIREITVTPQLQLTFQNLWIKSYSDAGGNRIAYDDEESLEVRVGSAFEVAINDSVSLYSQLNILHQLLDAPSVVFGSDGGGVPVSMDWDDTSFEARLGVRLSPLNVPYSGYVEAKYQAPFDGGGDTESWSATGGLSYRF